METGATECEIWEKKLEKRLQDPKTEPLVSLPLYFLKDITSGFSTEQELGSGAYGIVYKGVLRSGKAIAIKKIRNEHLHGNQVENEIICLKEVRHQNIIQLLGYCVETKKELMEYSGKHVMAEKCECLLCFEFLCNGSLDKYVSDDALGLDWDMRYEIIRGVCRGLHYLHDKHRIVHRDLKPQNILMDNKMMPKIGDFDLSRIFGQEKSRTVTTNFAGTLGYMSPECIEKQFISFEADIFSLGVIIIEIITGRKDYPGIGERTETSLKHYTDKDRRNQNLQTQVNVNTINIPATFSAINGLNECAHLFQWVILAISSPKLQLNEIQIEKLHGNVRQLHNDLQCLSDTLPAMYNLIDRAEWRIHDHYVADLLSKLKDTVYDAEDILDEFRWYETQLSVEGNAIPVKPIIDFIHSVAQASFNKVTDIQKRLDHLSGQLEKMGLLQSVPRFDKTYRPETTCFPTEPKIFGRNEEKEKLIRLLGVPINNNVGPSGHKRKRSGVCSSACNQICATIDSNEARITSVPVLPIVGIGGVGKTTLAQDICNHSIVKRHFDMIIWICVSDDFDVKRLTKEVIEQSTSPEKVPKTDNLSLLQSALAKSLNKKRFLLVLDDMWSEKKEDWKRFYAPFRNLHQGSMMLVTTRSPKVADVVRTMDAFPLGGLNEGVLWKFFELCVFGYDNFKNYPELKRIGEKILPKLKGSPLAAKTLGRLLGISLDLAHWDMILKNELWQLTQEETDILPALRLSYMYLPSYLKRCFSLCAVYPKDYNFTKNDLAEIWEAEGLVEHQSTGEQYFEELAYLSFFQKYPQSKENYVIHDLMHDMAQLVSRDECFTVKEKNDLPKIPRNVRHLLVLKGGDVECLDLLRYDMARHRKLRTLLCSLPLNSKTGNNVMEKWCTKLLCMRVMVCSSISKWGLPGSISNMKHLRYLKTMNSCPNIDMKRLHVSHCPNIKSLHLFSPYLKKLYLEDSGNLGYKFECSSLTILHLSNCPLESIELQMWNLPLLQELEISSCPFLTVIKESEPVNDILHGQARSRDIDNTFLSLTDVENTDSRNLSSQEQFLQPVCMPIIMKIYISNCRSLDSVPTDRFEYFPSLQVLHVSHCPMIKSELLYAPSLKELYLENSGNLGYKIECSSLIILHLSNYPLESIELQMWNLPLLQELEISSCPTLTVIRDSEPISSDILHGEARSSAIDNTFLSPANKEITDSRNLSSQEQFLQPVHMPIIMKIKISDCRSLESVPTERFGYFRFLEVLSVSNCPKIKSRHLLAPSLKELYLEDSGDLGYKIECSSLTILHLSGSLLESIELQMWNLPLLQELKISFCLCLTVIRDSEPISSAILHGEAKNGAIVNTFLFLTDVQIRRCHNLSSVEQFLQPAYVPNIKKIEISFCSSLSLPIDRLRDLCCLEVLWVFYCEMIKSQRLFVPSLKDLHLESSGNYGGNIECSSLTILQLLSCPIEAIEVRNFPLLQKLKISYCKELRSIGGPDAIAHIRDLCIENCPELKEIDQPLRKGSFS